MWYIWLFDIFFDFLYIFILEFWINLVFYEFFEICYFLLFDFEVDGYSVYGNGSNKSKGWWKLDINLLDWLGDYLLFVVDIEKGLVI